MNLKEYMKNNYRNPNPYILEDLGASEDLIEYLRTTLWNSNFNMFETLGYNSGADEEEDTEVIIDTIVGPIKIQDEAQMDFYFNWTADEKYVINSKEKFSITFRNVNGSEDEFNVTNQIQESQMGGTAENPVWTLYSVINGTCHVEIKGDGTIIVGGRNAEGYLPEDGSSYRLIIRHADDTSVAGK